MGALRVEIGEQPPPGWNERVLASTSGSLQFYHSTHWADRLAELLGDVPVYASVYGGNEPVVMLLCFEEAAWRRTGSGLRALAAAVRRLLPPRRTFRWYGEPLLVGPADAAAYRLLADALSARLRESRRRLSAGQWPLALESTLPEDWQRRRWATLKVNLEQPLDVIRAGCRSAARKEVRKAEARGIEVRRVETLAELREYGDEAVRCAARYGKTNVSTADYLSLWRHCRRNGFIFETFTAYHERQFVAGLSVWGTPQAVAEFGSFQSAYAYQQKLSGPDLLKWRVIDWAKGQGVRVFDLSGVNPDPQTQKERDIRRFKEKWGGVLEEYLVVKS